MFLIDFSGLKMIENVLLYHIFMYFDLIPNQNTLIRCSDGVLCVTLKGNVDWRTRDAGCGDGWLPAGGGDGASPLDDAMVCKNLKMQQGLDERALPYIYIYKESIGLLLKSAFFHDLVLKNNVFQSNIMSV